MSEKMIEACARAAHEVNRAYCIALGDTSQAPWESAPEWQEQSARNGVIGALSGATPRESHESWMAEKRATGWKYGPVKDVEKREHPCFVPYDELPPAQRAKDGIFVTVVRVVGNALGDLSPHLADVSRPFGERNLLEAKDAAVRALLAKP